MSYPSDLKEKQWELIKDNFSTGNYGKSRKHDKHVLVNAVIYVIKTGCQWRFLPNEYPPWKTVYSFFKRARDKNIWENVLKELVEKSRLKMGRNPNPSYTIIDSQSVKTAGAAKEKGFDGGKKNKRSKASHCN